MASPKEKLQSVLIARFFAFASISTRKQLLTFSQADVARMYSAYWALAGESLAQLQKREQSSRGVENVEKNAAESVKKKQLADLEWGHLINNNYPTAHGQPSWKLGKKKKPQKKLGNQAN